MNEMNRREFVKRSMLIAASAPAALGASGMAVADDKPAVQSGIEAKGDGCPVGKIGNLTMSRLILGSNLISAMLHSRGMNYINNLVKHYNTEDKIIETFAVAESLGINTIMIQADDYYIGLVRKYRDIRKGRLQIMVGLHGLKQLERGEINRLVDMGVDGMYIHGATSDPLFSSGRMGLVAKALEDIRLRDVPAGVCCHDLNVIKYCEDNKLGAEFYVMTFHHHQYPAAPDAEQLKGVTSEVPGYWCRNPAETIAVMKTIRKPIVAFKVMAAGAIPPENAFNYAYQNGADFILAGMFDFEIAADVKIAREAITAASARQRPWYG